MKRILLSLLLLFGFPLAAWSMPQLELDVQLDPATRQFSATATLTDAQGLTGFRLGRAFEITALKLDGRSSSVTSRPARSDFRLPPGTRKVELAYRATLPPTQALDHRQVLGQHGGTASPDGSFVPASAGWYPDPGQRFGYRVTLRLPAGQKGLVPGDLREESDTPAGYRAAFDFPHPADGIDLMTGPYVIGERTLSLDARTIRIRTWFHPELATLAQGYLDDSAKYIERYSQLIGAYPFGMFSVVSSPTPTGFGMPSLTYLGRDVIRLPFIRATSLGHEVLHNWWGNGVYPDWRTGNWSEGLTTFLADYAYKEEDSADAAREMRMGWLRDLAAVPPGEAGALKDFTSRHHGIASIIGYNKAAMVFLMLRDQIGREAFERGLRLLWERKRFQTASWADLEAVFATAAGRPLGEFFTPWVQRAGTPAFTGADPDFRVWRRVDPAVFPPILREVFVAPRASVVVTEADLQPAARALAARVLDAPPGSATEKLPGRGPVLIVGRAATLDAWLKAHSLSARPFPQEGSAQVWAGRDADGRSYAVISARDAAALAALERGLPHYGKQSWLVFEGARATGKGIWPPRQEDAK